MPLRLELRASPVLALLAAAAHCAAAVVLWAFLPTPMGAMAAMLVFVLAVYAIRDRAMLSADTAWVRIELGREGGVHAISRNGEEFRGQVAARRYVSRWLVVLPLSGARWGRSTILIARDMLAAGDFRHLRLWALWNALPAPRAALAPAPDA